MYGIAIMFEMFCKFYKEVNADLSPGSTNPYHGEVGQ